MHPPLFRRRFSAEMLCIFHEAMGSESALSLCWDCCVSLARQWILRSGFWRVAIALLGACLQFSAAGVIWLALGLAGPSYRGTAVQGDLAQEGLKRFIIGAGGGIALMVTMASLWMNRFIRQRIHDLRVGK
jgi:hypothetical protein